MTLYERLAGTLRDFAKLESASGLVLLAAAILALIASNSPLSPLYDLFLRTPVAIRVGALHLDKPLLLWINDGLMALFFLVVGAEIKREVIEGELSSIRRAILPVLAALGGMAVPAVLYILVSQGDRDMLAGWAIPTATDIAFALAALSVIGKAAPPSLKVFLLALAIIDDLGAIVIIAIFYTSELSALALGLAAGVLAFMFLLNRLGVKSVAPYAMLGVILWVLVLKSGVHATLAGVATALAIPLKGKEGASPLKHVEHSVAPWSSFLVMPLFGFANAGLNLAGVGVQHLFHGVASGIAVGLFFGKQIGVFGATWLAVRLGLGERPRGVSWSGIYGVSFLAGIGFTMSLFIGTLAWGDGSHAAEIRLGVLEGSLLSAVAGIAILLATQRGPKS
ncbi:MAG TPA: Na+/H+ antiporter NhaA [Dongiaceae bacterium]|nr:Na+/H+ antiporter NhaA [Dongiaceae bacterium]